MINEQDIQKVNSITEIQQAIKDIICENTYFAKHNVPILIENSKTIDFDIKNAIGKIGIACVVTTPMLNFRGDYADADLSSRFPFWKMETCNITFAETPTLNRGRANYCTSMDAALQAAECFTGNFGFNLTSINQTEQNGILLVTLTLKTDAIFRFEKEVI